MSLLRKLLKKPASESPKPTSVSPKPTSVSPPKSTITRPPQPFEPDMVLIPAGEFLMGSNEKEAPPPLRHELPQHRLYLPDYYISRYLVTNAQYAAFVQATARKPPNRWLNGLPPIGKEKHPVVWITWYDASAYCRWLAEATGRPYRLPTEAEWEKAARGPDGHIYPWGDEFDKDRCNTRKSGIDDTTLVGQYSPAGDSPYGVADMAGNVWEWTSSLYKGYPYQADDGREDLAASSDRVVRGGSWNDFPSDVRCAYRNAFARDFHDSIYGFRCCYSAR